MATSPLPSQGPTRGQNGYVTRAFSGDPNKEDEMKHCYLTLAFSGPHKSISALMSAPKKARVR